MTVTFGRQVTHHKQHRFHIFFVVGMYESTSLYCFLTDKKSLYGIKIVRCADRLTIHNDNSIKAETFKWQLEGDANVWHSEVTS